MCVYRRSIYLGFDLDLVARNNDLDNALTRCPLALGKVTTDILACVSHFELLLLHACRRGRSWLKTTHLMQNEHPRPRT